MKKGKKEEKKENEERLYAFLCYLISIIGVILVLATKSERKSFSIYHAKQGLVLFIAMVIVAIISTLFNFIPVIGRIISTILWILIGVLWIVGMVNSLNGKEAKLPIIGHYAKAFKF